MWSRNWIINSSVLLRRDAFDALGGFNEAKELVSVEDYNLWIRAAASDWRIVTCPHVLVHYTRGIGISSNFERFLKASLYNVDDIGTRLSLPDRMVRKKRNDIIAEFGRKALFDRDLATARQLLWRACRERPTPRAMLAVLAASMPAPVLDLKRGSLRLIRRETAVIDGGLRPVATVIPGGAGAGWYARGVAKGEHHAAAREINQIPIGI